MKKKSCSIKEATAWFAKQCPNTYAAARAEGTIKREDILKAIEILKANDKKKYEVIIMPGSPAWEYLRSKKIITGAE